jgi:hypothetical protein
MSGGQRRQDRVVRAVRSGTSPPRRRRVTTGSAQVPRTRGNSILDELGVYACQRSGARSANPASPKRQLLRRRPNNESEPPQTALRSARVVFRLAVMRSRPGQLGEHQPLRMTFSRCSHAMPAMIRPVARRRIWVERGLLGRHAEGGLEKEAELGSGPRERVSRLCDRP